MKIGTWLRNSALCCGVWTGVMFVAANAKCSLQPQLQVDTEP